MKAYVFPGQASQFEGMGKDETPRFEIAEAIDWNRRLSKSYHFEHVYLKTCSTHQCSNRRTSF